jgi:hypothetical protein
MLVDSLASFWAEEDDGSLVTAGISKWALQRMRFLIIAPPCLPVAPVMRTAVIVTDNPGGMWRNA